MSTYSGSSRGSTVASSRGSVVRRPSGHHQSLPPPPPPSHHSNHMPPPPPSGIDHVRTRQPSKEQRQPPSVTRGVHASSHRSNGKPSSQKESVMARNRQTRAPTAVEPEDAVTVSVSIVGAKFQCLVERDWPCESLVASAIAEYHLAYPTCEVPDCSVIYHVGRKEAIAAKDPVGKWCREGDEIELGIKDRAIHSADHRPPLDDQLNLNTYDFTIVFHRLPLGFTLKQEMDATVVANIYPKSAATHYERLVPGVIVVKIGDTPLEFLGLRQVHEVIRNCKLPLQIRFRGWKKPTPRRASFSGIADVLSPKAAIQSPPVNAAPPPQRRKSVPTRQAAEIDDVSSNGSRRERSNTVASASSATGPPPLALTSETTGQTAHTPSPYTQRLSTERKKTNASSPYPEHRVVAAERRARRDSTGVDLSVPLVDQLDASSNQGGSPEVAPSSSSPAAISELKAKQREFHLQGAPLPRTEADSVAEVTDRLAATRVGQGSHEAAFNDADSNQNEDESEEMLARHIKILQSELAKKYEEAKLLADQLERYHARYAAIKHKRSTGNTATTASTVAATTAPSVQTSATKPKLTLTPEVLEAMDTKAGLPPKDGQYAGSNSSAVSGYSNYSSRSAVGKRHAQQLSRVVGRTGGESGPSNASVSSASRRSRTGSFSDGSSHTLKSPRGQSIHNRYNYIPPSYSDPPSSFSTKGGLISRAKATRDSYIQIPDTPGVGAYDVKAPRDKVRGGEIGDSDRALPWP